MFTERREGSIFNHRAQTGRGEEGKGAKEKKGVDENGKR
jgi:hypothetical protein